ncbi:MAG: SUMF1/EgtB/PvdO family nonheme iron enzyme [Terriglobales bacterium]
MASPHLRWRQSQAASDQLWTRVRPEAMTARPVPERHRLIFYLGHLEAFDWNLLAPALELRPFRAEWDQLFAFGIDPLEGALPSDAASAWPAPAEVGAYNRQVRERLEAALAAKNGADPAGAQRMAELLEVALEHRWMHVETLSYLFHNLDYEQKLAPALDSASPQQAAPAAGQGSAVRIPAGAVRLGQPRGASFGWDNEFEAHTVEVDEFAAERYKVTNRDYLAFVEGGAEAPHFWMRHGEQWWLRGMFAAKPLPLDWPVYVTHHQARAYCGWAGKRLPSEAEWQRMAYASPAGEERQYPWGSAAPAEAGPSGWDPMPTQARPDGASAWGVEDLIGNGWEWTSSVFAPFPGFAAFDFYPGYSANFFDGKHYVLKGGSPRTAACLLRRSFRNWFQPNYPYAYAGFRCIA